MKIKLFLFFCSFIFAKLQFHSLSLAHISFLSLLSFSIFLIPLSYLFFAAISSLDSLFLFFLFHLFLLLLFSNFSPFSKSSSVTSFFCTANLNLLSVLGGNCFSCQHLFCQQNYRPRGRHSRKYIERSFDF